MGERVIYKYVITANQDSILVPAGARVLDVQMQYGRPTVWFLIDPGQPVVNRKIKIMPTGLPVPEEELRDMDYIGTFQVLSGTLVFHLFIESGAEKQQTM